MRSSFFAAGILLALSQAGMAAPTVMDCVYKVKESIVAPQDWVKFAPAFPDHQITLRIALPQPRFSELNQHLLEVSDPDHARYGNYLSKEEVEELVSPRPDSVRLVSEWFTSHGILDSDVVRTPAQDWATITVPIRVAEKMLDTEYHIWKHVDTGEFIVRTTHYSLPDILHQHIDLVQPTTMFARWSGMKSTLLFEDNIKVEKTIQSAANQLYSLSGLQQDDGANDGDIDPTCAWSITIKCLMQLYNVAGYMPEASARNSIGITGYLENFANFEDIKTMFSELRPDAINATFNVVSIKGGLNDQTLSKAGAEANLDMQYGLGMAFPINATFYTTGGRPPFSPDLVMTKNTNEPYLDWVEYVLSQPDPPYVISTSYGEDEQTVPRDYAIRVCNSFAQLSARGVSLIFSSGDAGVGDGKGGTDHKCYSNDGNNTYQFLPLFPSSCPFVTSVGATTEIPEVAVSFSGGGFSNYFARPSYQDGAVQGFLRQHPEGMYQGLYNVSGRGTPDIAAQGRRFKIHNRGAWGFIGGTSASAPAVAAIVALLNDVRLVNGKSPLGFLNPLLYSRGIAGLNDITSGNNPGCGTMGFNATPGWDPVTGLGTPNFGKLKEIVMESPDVDNSIPGLPEPLH